MNYAYAGGLGGEPGTIAGTLVDFSRGLLPPVDECALVEEGVFAGVPAGELGFLGWYLTLPGPWTALADGSVDWNHDGVIGTAPYEQLLHEGFGCSLLHDHDDFARISAGLRSSLPSNPDVFPPSLLAALPHPVRRAP